MYVQGVSTRKVKAVTEALCGHSFSASSISAINKSVDEGLHAFAERRLTECYPYLILDARYEKVREAEVIVSQVVLVAVAVDEVRRDIATWLGKWQAKYPRLCNWVEDNIEETLTYYRLPLPHHKPHEVDQHARTAEPGTKAPHSRGPPSSPMPRAVCGWCRRWPSRCTRTGSKPRATSTWTI